MQVNAIPGKKPTTWWKLAINITVPLLLIFVFAREIDKSWPDIRHYHWAIDWRLATLAILVLCVNSLVEILIWNKTLSWFTAPLPFNQVTPIYIWSSLARYVPGKVFSLFLRAALCAQVQCDIIASLAASTVELALRTASGFLLFLLVLISSGNITPQRYLLLLLVILVLICAHPRIMLPVMNWILTKIKQQRIEKTLRYRDVLFIFAAIIGRWMIYGLGMTLLAAAIFSPALKYYLMLIGTAAAWVVYWFCNIYSRRFRGH